MIIRFVVKNLFSFNELTEFNMVPSNGTSLPHHVYKHSNALSTLRMSAIYGANAAGKSNLLKAIGLLKEVVEKGTIDGFFKNKTFRFNDVEERIYLGIEFLVEDIKYYYGLEIEGNKITEEEFTKISLAEYSNDVNQKDEVIFKRTHNGKRIIELNENLKLNEKTSADDLKKAIEIGLAQDNELLINRLAKLVDVHDIRNNRKEFNDIIQLINWFDIIFIIDSKDAFSSVVLKDNELKLKFDQVLSETIKGIKSTAFIQISVEEYLKELPDKYSDSFLKATANFPINHIVQNSENKDVIIQKNSSGKVSIEQLEINHENNRSNIKKFKFLEESDGTQRMFLLISILIFFKNSNWVFLIDEIEHSIHPSLIKDFINKISKEEDIEGQLIFTTHDTQLLDLEILRPDEIWFAEKKPDQSTTLYPLSDFKLTEVMNIEKGYLNGRFGAIPFLGDFKDLNLEDSNA